MILGGAEVHRNAPGNKLSSTSALAVTSPITCTNGLIPPGCTCISTPQQYNITITVTIPQNCIPSDRDSGATVFFYNGFGGKPILTAADYAPYAAILASAGYSTVQYDVNQVLAMVPDLEELTFLPQIYNWLRQQQHRQTFGVLADNLDLKNVALAGHSRGGKLAALQYANGTLPNTFAAFLVDPVDNPCFAATPECYPSAREALAAAGRPIAAVGATIRGCCNPNHPSPGQPQACSFCTGYTAEDLVAAAGHGSPLYPRAAGHMQFAQLPAWEQGPANLGCGSNASVTSLEVIQDVATLMVAWFDQELANALSVSTPATEQGVDM
ncbi:g5499 [Coccomyxa elongata]